MYAHTTHTPARAHVGKWQIITEHVCTLGR